MRGRQTGGEEMRRGSQCKRRWAHSEFSRVLKVNADEKREMRDRGACSCRELLVGRLGERLIVLTAALQ